MTSRDHDPEFEDRWPEVWELFEQAVDLPKTARTEFVEQRCGDDTALKRALVEMLEADKKQTDVFLDRETAPSDTTELMPPTFTRTPGNGPPQERLGPYRLLNKVGEGGMSSVYLAVRDDDAYQRRVVVKVIKPGMESDHVVQRLRVERQILASLDHPNIARLYDGGATDRGLPYFVLEYVDGVPIDTFCERNELNVKQRLELFCKVCSAVGYAHRNLVIHRDIKPSNILVSSDGEPKLLDFGIAKLLNPNLASPEIAPTVTATRMLTPSYASPEQIRGQMITTASDVYSLGVLLYKLLTQTLPFDFRRRSAAEIEQLVTESEPPKPSQVATRDPTDSSPDPRDQAKLRRQLAGDLDAIVLKTLRSAPQKRYSTVEQLTADIDRFLEGRPVEARRGSRRYKLGKFVRRHRTALGVIAAVAFLVLWFMAALTRQSARLAIERDQARLARDEKQHVITLFEDIIAYAGPFVAPGEKLSVEEAVKRSVPVLETRLEDQPLVRAQLLHTTGSMLTQLNQFDDARAQLEEALHLRRTHGSDDREVAQTLTALASVLGYQGQYDEALEQTRESITLLRDPTNSPEDTFGADPILVEALNLKVKVLCAQEEYQVAEEPALEALTRSKELFGNQRRYRMDALNMMATVKNKLGDYSESVSLRRQSLAISRELYGENHPSQRVMLSNLGLALRWSGEMEAAERTYREVLALTESLYGPESQQYAYNLNNIAGLKFAQGDYAGALEDYEKVSTVFRGAIGAEHWRNFFFAVNTEASRVRAGDPELAERRLRSGLGLWTPKLGDDHWLVAHAHSVLGESLLAQGSYDESEPLLVDSFKKLIELGAKDRYLRQALDRLSRFLDDRGRAGEIVTYEQMLPQAAEG